MLESINVFHNKNKQFQGNNELNLIYIHIILIAFSPENMGIYQYSE